MVFYYVFFEIHNGLPIYGSFGNIYFAPFSVVFQGLAYYNQTYIVCYYVVR